MIEIKSITPIEDWCLGNKLNLPQKICLRVNKNNRVVVKENDECRSSKGEDTWSNYYLQQPYFYGKFKVDFIVNEYILVPIFYPLLDFMNKYGFWGGKWNIGYGRLEAHINERNDIKEVTSPFDFKLREIISNITEEHYLESKELEANPKEFVSKLFGIIKPKGEFSKKMILIKLKDLSNISKGLPTMTKELIKIKYLVRRNLRYMCEKQLRHKLLGEKGEGSKLLPFITNIGEVITKAGESGLLSITGLLNLEAAGRNND